MSSLVLVLMLSEGAVWTTPVAFATSNHDREQAALRFKTCGYGCPEGYHVAGQTCDIVACVLDCPNQVICEPNEGQSFEACGYGCPDGYHVTSQTCDLECGLGCPNQVTCEKH